MADETSVTAEYPRGNGVGIVGGVAEFGNNVVSLFELQAKLTALDIKECTGKATWPVVFVAVAAVLLISAVTVGLFGAAEVIAKALTISNGWAMILTAFVGLTLAALILFVSTSEIKNSVVVFRRSHEELVRNLAWLRTVLVHSGRTTTNRNV